MQYKLKHRLSAALMAGAMCCTMIPAASADEIATPETVDTAVPEVTDSVTPALSQITENLYNDLPDAPTGSYIGSMGLPVATGKTKISISSWVSDLYDGVDAHMDADALSEDETTIIVGKGSDSDYAVVPLSCLTVWNFSAMRPPTMTSSPPMRPSRQKSCTRPTPSSLRRPQGCM